jgi:translocation and assembly module TamA
MSGRGSTRKTALLSCAAALAAVAATPCRAQSVPPPSDPAELDPSAPLAPMPDLGVPWPDMKAPDEAKPPEAVAVPGAAAPAQITDETGARKYTFAVEGLNATGDVEDLLKAFRQQSALEA